MTMNAVSAPLPSGSSTGLNLRFLAVVPTSIPWLSVEVGTSFAPLGLSNGLRDFNEPTFFYGPTIMLLPRDRTSNWIELTLPVLGAYRLDETGEAERLYVNDLVIQGTAIFPIGQKLMADMGPFWSRLTRLRDSRAESDAVTQRHDAEGRSTQPDVPVRDFDSDSVRRGMPLARRERAGHPSPVRLTTDDRSTSLCPASRTMSSSPGVRALANNSRPIATGTSQSRSPCEIQTGASISSSRERVS